MSTVCRSADQAGSRTTAVSPSTAALSLTGGGNTSSPTISTSYSQTSSSSIFSKTSISVESATTETVYSSTRFSITNRGTSSSVSSSKSSLDPPQSPSSTPTTSTAQTSSRITTETFTPEPSTSTSSQEPPMSSSITDSPSPSGSSSWSGSSTVDPSISSAPPTAMSSLPPNSTDGDSSTIPLTTVFSSTIISITSTSIIVLPLPTSIATSSDAEPPTSFSSGLLTDSFPSTSSTNPIPLPVTLTSTKFVTIFTDGGSSTSSRLGGVLRTDAPIQASFARNTGAVIAVSLSVAVALIVAVLVTFFACKRYRSRNNSSGSMENILALAREVSWRRPVDGEDDDSIIGGFGGSLPPHQNGTLGRRSHSGEGAFDGYGGAGDQIPTEPGGQGSAESSNAGMAPPLHPTFGGQPYMPGYVQTNHGPVAQPNSSLPRYASATGPDSSQTWLGISPQAYYENSGGQNHISPGRSAVSLTLAGSSSGGHGSSSGEGSKAKPHLRVSLTGPRPIPPSADGRRHSSAPPTAFMGARESFFDHERQRHTEQSDRGSVRSFLSRLRNGRRTSTQSLSTIRGVRPARGSKESLISHEPSNQYSPSLLNPPITIPPARAILRFPRGVTGNSYAPMPPEMTERYTSAPSSGLWPPVTLPPPPSPVPTDNSSMAEGLLHPRLGLGMDHLQQASTASLRDHEDYTRPINGLVNNHIRSTTTFEILDTNGTEEGPSKAR
ncbi:hypothetical protein M413DRAFT_30449 [Hebeloma cylindrosporum]|uniref:REJ domain-containing protein n=1 Tax=Hebeloma cylindrosporum TaxID=76867 RepID=A0A0C3BMY6_HEBCY|nr:hypothetical protein M413DRAFT_30449 [Hebeloma cylindrosporum h7]